MVIFDFDYVQHRIDRWQVLIHMKKGQNATVFNIDKYQELTHNVAFNFFAFSKAVHLQVCHS